ncbi:hypothetical protein F9B85_05705 [Heliorestis acidaminivorans]|uniref:Cytochrome c domain-containing protein n=1 Tax=Heliorestis acidaminivorans TaxID=553427 RepID=A0A6I0F7N3_9FIRM|nr:cbb3-type cytochrome c oxidase subunit II [Heliorestis acidaminivorans]KAB2953403.1 hypothetical protein F9B85_05705 [Heliorestis acidaminivorans]
MERNTTKLIVLSLFFFAVGFVATVLLPFMDQGLMRPTPTAEYRKELILDQPDSPEARGRALYMQYGCQYCHSQWVRPVLADERLGPVLRAGDSYYDAPHLHGSARIGPDLLWVGDRIPDKGWHIQHLIDPQGVVEGSIMPSYNWLTEEELEALAAYMVSLKYIENPDDVVDPQYRY